MEDFIKITEELYYDTAEKNKNIRNLVCNQVGALLTGNTVDFEMCMEESLIDCESPIEQIMAVELEDLRLKEIYKYNPYIDVVAIEKQKIIQCKKNSYRVDFAIHVVYKNQGKEYPDEFITFVIECDGHEFHQKTKEQVERDNTRMRDLQKEEYEVIRFSGTEIWHRPYKCALEVLNIILSKCKYIRGDFDYGDKKSS